MIRTILFLYSILSVAMAANQRFTVSSDDSSISLATQNGAGVYALMAGDIEELMRKSASLRDENNMLMSCIEQQKQTIKTQQQEITWLRWRLQQAHLANAPPPYPTTPLASGSGTAPSPPPPYHEVFDADAPRGWSNAAAAIREPTHRDHKPRLKRLEDNPLYKEFINHTLISLLVPQETDIRRKVMIKIVIGRKIAAERKGEARLESITYFKEAQTLSETQEGLKELWEFATIGLGLAYCDNSQNLRGLLELYKQKEEARSFVIKRREHLLKSLNAGYGGRF